MKPLERPCHGGRLNAAAEQWGRPVEQWLDLSTGINPVGWPVPGIPLSIWRRLPEQNDGLGTVIREWTGAPDTAGCLATSGSQPVIQALPCLRRPCRVAVPTPGYEEHGYWWARRGHEVVGLSAEAIDERLQELDVVVWIQPNNPTGQVLPHETLLKWHQSLTARGGWLVVDEAFFIPGKGGSLAGFCDRPGLIVLRSLGKFFGLAGVRAGTVLAEPVLCEQLDACLGPWAVSGPARYLMSTALKDTAWQSEAAVKLAAGIERLEKVLTAHRLAESSGTLLFRYWRHPAASVVFETLADHGILVRQFREPEALRFGLPGNEFEWQRLADALKLVRDKLDLNT